METEKDFSKMTREELIAALTSSQVSTKGGKKSSSSSALTQVFKNLSLVLGTWEHINLPGYMVTVNKINQFDKRSMTILVNVVDANGNKLPRIMFGDMGNKKGEDTLNVALPTLLRYLKFTPKAKKSLNRINDILVRVNAQAAFTEKCGKGYATPARFDEHLNEVRTMLQLEGNTDLLAELA